MPKLKILCHGDNDDIAVSIDLETYRLLSGWMKLVNQPHSMSLEEVANVLTPLAIQTCEAMIRAGYIHEAGRIMWAIDELRHRAEAERPGVAAIEQTKRI